MLMKQTKGVITLEEKLTAIGRVKNREISWKVAADYSIGISAVSIWLKMKDELKQNSSKH